MWKHYVWAIALAFGGLARPGSAQELTELAIVSPELGVPAADGPMQVILVPTTEGATGLFEGNPNNIRPGTFSFFGNNLLVDIGFEYLRPYYSNGSTAFSIPQNVRSGFPNLSGSDDLTRDFSFVPRFELAYSFPNSNMSIGASTKLINIAGNVRQTISSPTVNAILNAEDSTDIGVLILPEATRRFDLGDYEKFEDTCFENTSLFVTLGARYSYLRQDFSAGLQNGPNIATRDATQDFNGIGITSALSTLQPLGDSKFCLYGTSRGSLLVGRNNRSSSFTIVTPNIPGGSTSSYDTEIRTQLIPVGEFEAGLSWGTPITGIPADGSSQGSLLWFKAGFVFQVWGDVGLLNSNSNVQNFPSDNLYLYGFSILAGLNF